LLVIRRVVTVRVDGGGAGLQPYVRWALRTGDGLTDDAGGRNPRVQDFVAIRSVVTTIDGSSRKVDDDA
jgi:hypothetical protein